jgi:hypothetical protein
MAQTKTSQRKAKPKARASSKPNAVRASKAKANASRKPKRARSTSKPKRTVSRPATSKPQAVREAVEETARDAGGAVGNAAGKVGHAASRAKVPLMAGGAALAGAAGGIALGAHQAHRKGGLNGVSSKLNGVSSKDLAKAARKVGDVGAQVGEVALEVRRARESTNGNGKVHRSPIEVVLQGLTQRRPRG